MNEETKTAIRSNPLAWIQYEGIKNEKGKPILLGPKSNHYFLRELYEQTHQKVAVRKPSQVGLSMWAVLTEIHAAKYWGINQIHTLPTKSDVNVFVPDKVTQVIRANPSIKKGVSQKDIDAVNQKQFGKGFLYFKGTVSKRETFMLSSDRNTYDEVDRSEITEIGNYSSRLEGADSLQMERWISTPTMPGYGIDMVWEGSTQRHWRFTCKHCQKEQHMKWPENVDMKKGKYICSRCGEEIDEKTLREGRWKARYPKRETEGYWITQMMAPWISPQQLIESFQECEKGENEMTLEYFYNHKLGVPYVETESQILPSMIYKNLTTKDHKETDSVMGVDVQLRELYVVIGNEEGVYLIRSLRDSDEYRATDGQKGKSKWDKLDQLIEVFGVRYGVIDAGFKPNDVLQYCERHPGKLYANWYKEDPKKLKVVRFAEDKGFTSKSDPDEEVKVLSDRNRLIDMVLEDLKKGRIKFFFSRKNKNVKELIRHLSTCYARVAEDRVGTEKREWVSSGQDDYLHALNYYKIALMKKKRTEELT